jgi:hypothetical protein
MSPSALFIFVSPEVLQTIMEQLSPDVRFTDTTLGVRNFWLYSPEGRPVYFTDAPLKKLECRELKGVKGVF